MSDHRVLKLVETLHNHPSLSVVHKLVGLEEFTFVKCGQVLDADLASLHRERIGGMMVMLNMMTILMMW